MTDPRDNQKDTRPAGSEATGTNARSAKNTDPAGFVSSALSPKELAKDAPMTDSVVDKHIPTTPTPEQAEKDAEKLADFAFGHLPEEASRTFEELQVGDRIDRSEIISEGVKEMAAWSMRLLLIAAATYMLWFITKQFWQGILPVVFALILSSVLWGPNQWLRDRGFPRALAAISSILLTFLIFGGLIAFIAPSMARQSQTLYLQSFEGLQKAQLWMQGPPLNVHPEDLDKAFSGTISWLQDQSGKIAGQLAAGIGAMSLAVVTLGVVLVLTFFFLKDGDRFLPWLRSVTGRRAGWHLTELLTRAWITLSGFIRAQALVSLVDAVFIGLGLVLIGVPMALALATLTFIAGFIPIVGAVVAGVLAILIAFVSLGFTQAVMVAVLVIAVQQLEGNILSPMLQSRAMNLHPVIVLVSVTMGSGLFGIIGAFLAVPFAAMVAVLLRYLGDMIALRAGEKTADEIEFATAAGSMTGLWSEEVGRRLRAAKIAPLRSSSDPAEAEEAAATTEAADTTKDSSMVEYLLSTPRRIVHMFPGGKR